MSEYGNRGGRGRGNFSNERREDNEGFGRGGSRGGRGRGYRGNYNNNWNNGRDERSNGQRQEYRQDFRRDQGGYGENRFGNDNQYRGSRDRHDRGYGGYNRESNGYGDRRDERAGRFRENDDRYGQQNYRQDNRRGGYNNRDSPQRNYGQRHFGDDNQDGRGSYQHQGTPPRDYNRHNYENSDSSRNQRSPEEYGHGRQSRGGRGRGNYSQQRPQGYEYGNQRQPAESFYSQEDNQWKPFGQSQSSSQSRQERIRDISPESASSVETTRSKASAMSASSSNLSITPLQTPTSSCPPSPSVKVLTETAIQLSLQDQPGTSRDSAPTSKLLVDAPMLPASRHDKEIVNLTTNFYPIEVHPKTVYQYDVDIKVVAADGSKVNHLKGMGNKIQKADTCVAAIRAALEAYNILRRGEATLFDGGTMLYSSESLLAALKPHSNVLYVSIANLPEHIRRTITVPNATDIAIEVGGEDQFNLADYDRHHRNRNLGNLNRTHQSFFDVLTNEPSLRSGNYVAFGSGRMFPRDQPGQKIRNGQELQKGINKGIVFIEPTDSRMVPALVLDSKLGQFYTPQDLMETLEEVLNMRLNSFPWNKKLFWNKANQFVKGMRFTITIGLQERTFTASGISSAPIGNLTEKNIENENVPVLQLPRFGGIDPNRVDRNLPAIVVRGKIGKNIVTSYYPMDLLKVAKNQRVPQSKIDDKPRAPRVQDRFRDIQRMVGDLHLDSRSPYNGILRAFGVSVSRDPLKIQGFRRRMPDVSFDRKTTRPLPENASFKIFEYKIPGKVEDVVVAYDCPLNIIKEMQKALEMAAKQKGLQILRWHSLDVGPYGPDSQQKVHAAFEEVDEWRKVKKVGKTVLIIYVDDQRNNSHGFLKYYERYYMTLTQHLTVQIAKDLAYKWQTRENVLHKMNCKLGGINYGLAPDEYVKNDWISNGKSLVVGYDVTHPTGMSHDDKIDKKPPNQASVVGMSFNGAEHPEAFIGDYHYQLPKKEEVSDNILSERIKWMLELFYKNRKRLPENIFFIRDGVSEGQYNMVLNKELPAFQDGIEEFKNMKEGKIPKVQEWTPKYVVVVVCKRHSKRFARENNGRFENAQPGTVVDDKVVRKDMTHFYMQPHRAIQGTGKFPSYHVLKYDLDQEIENKTQDKLQAFLFALSFEHQIFAGSISLPEPVYQADEWAKRGKDLFKVYEELYDFPRLTKWNKNLYATAPIDYEELTRRLCLKGTPLQAARINA